MSWCYSRTCESVYALRVTVSRVPEGQPGARLEAVERAVRAHLRAPHRRPVPPERHAALDELGARLDAHDGPVWLDAGCGTGQSTANLAAAHPDVLVVGVDKSARRLDRGAARSEAASMNVIHLRADLVDLWTVADAEGWRFDRTWLLYPNPWPKSVHMKRRWYAHPIFPALLRTARSIELRTNWAPYAREMAHALSVVDGEASAAVEAWTPESRAAISPFERKYGASGHALWRVTYRRPTSGALAATMPR